LLADAQLVLARSYKGPSGPRLMLPCRLIDAIWSDDVDAVRALMLQHPGLLHEDALVRKSNRGPPDSGRWPTWYSGACRRISSPGSGSPTW